MNQNRTNKFVHTRAVIKLAVLAATFALFSSSIIGSAKEGMFTPEQLSDIAKQLRSAGLKLNASQLSDLTDCLLYTSPSPRDQRGSRMPSSA